MKRINLIAMLLLSLFINALAQEKIVASNCHKNGGRCTGSAYCSACSNCSRCAHCNSGGTCGVCSGSGSGRSYTTSSRRTRSYLNERSSKDLYVKVGVLNLRAGPGTEYDIIEKLSKGQTLIVLKASGNWIYVKVANTGSEGYVHKSYVK